MRYNHSECYDCKTKMVAPSFCDSCKYGGKPSGTSWKVTDQQIKDHRSKTYEEERKKQLEKRQRELNERLQHRLNQQTSSIDKKLEDLKRKLEGASERAYSQKYRKIPADYPPMGDKSRDYARKYRGLYDDKPSFFENMKEILVETDKNWKILIEEVLKPFFNNLLKGLKNAWKAVDNWLRT